MLDFWRSVDSIWCPSLHRWSECIPSRCRKLSCEPEVHLSFVWWDFFGMELLKMWSMNSILWVSSVTLLTSGAEFVAQWIFNCIILRSTVICGSVHLRKPIFFFWDHRCVIWDMVPMAVTICYSLSSLLVLWRGFEDSLVTGNKGIDMCLLLSQELGKFLQVL